MATKTVSSEKKQGQVLKSARIKTGLSELELAEIVGVLDSAIRNWEGGFTKNGPGQRSRKILEQALRIEVPVIKKPTRELKSHFGSLTEVHLDDLNPLKDTSGIYMLWSHEGYLVYIGKSDTSIKSCIYLHRARHEWYTECNVDRLKVAKVNDPHTLKCLEELLIVLLRSEKNDQHLS